MKRLKAGTETSDYRALHLLKQGGVDPITGLDILDPVLDHNHKSGRIRKVLDRRTNAWEGKVSNSWVRCGLRKIGADLPTCLRNLADYLEQDYSKHPLHSTFRTAEEKRALRNKRARKKHATARKIQ